MTKANTKKDTKTNTTSNKKVDVPDDMLNDILAQLTDYKVAPVADEDLTKEINYVLAANGLFKVTKKPVAVYTEKVEDMKTTLPGLPNMEEGFRLLIPKIPGRYLIQLLSWYRDVYKQDGTECSALFFWNHRNIEIPTTDVDGTPLTGLTVDGQLVLYIPEQENEPALSTFSDDKMVDWFRQNMALLLEHHSHNSMDAFFSGIDDANEKMNQFYGVWGRIDKDMPSHVLRYVVGNTRKSITLDQLFDLPTVEVTTTTTTKMEARLSGNQELVLQRNLSGSTENTETHVENIVYQGPWPELEYPSDWMPKHTPVTYKPIGGSYVKGKVWDQKKGTYVWPENHSSTGYGYGWDDDEWDAWSGTGRTHAGKTQGEIETDGELPFTYSLDFAEKSDETDETKQSIMQALQEMMDNYEDTDIHTFLKNNITPKR